MPKYHIQENNVCLKLHNLLLGPFGNHFLNHQKIRRHTLQFLRGTMHAIAYSFLEYFWILVLEFLCVLKTKGCKREPVLTMWKWGEKARKWHLSLYVEDILFTFRFWTGIIRSCLSSLSPPVWREAMFSSNELHQAASKSEKVSKFR